MKSINLIYALPFLVNINLSASAIASAPSDAAKIFGQVPQEFALKEEDLGAQCDRLAGTVNQTQDIMMKFEAEIQDFSERASQVETFFDIKLAASNYVDAVDDTVSELNSLYINLSNQRLEDLYLIDFKTNYSVVIREFVSALQEASSAMNSIANLESEVYLIEAIQESQARTEIAVRQIEENSLIESQLISEVNQYCTIY